LQKKKTASKESNNMQHANYQHKAEMQQEPIPNISPSIVDIVLAEVMIRPMAWHTASCLVEIELQSQ